MGCREVGFALALALAGGWLGWGGGRVLGDGEVGFSWSSVGLGIMGAGGLAVGVRGGVGANDS